MRNRRKAFSTCSEVLAGARGHSRIRDGIRLWKVWDIWPSIVGEALAPHALPAAWRGRDLVVRVKHAAWAQELGFLKKTLVEKIAKALPDSGIREVRFEVGTLPDPPKGASKRTPARKRKLGDDEIEFIEQAAGEIPDEETRDAARSAMRKGFSSKSS